MSDLVGNYEDWFSRVVAHFISPTILLKQSLTKPDPEHILTLIGTKKKHPSQLQ